MAETPEIRVVLFREGDMWVAQCVEYDIGAQGKDLADVVQRLQVTLNVEVQESIARNLPPFSGIDRSPSYIEEYWSKAGGAYNPRSLSSDSPSRMQVRTELALCA